VVRGHPPFRHARGLVMETGVVLAPGAIVPVNSAPAAHPA
jgi:hypothetical protein